MPSAMGWNRPWTPWSCLRNAQIAASCRVERKLDSRAMAGNGTVNGDGRSEERVVDGRANRLKTKTRVGGLGGGKEARRRSLAFAQEVENNGASRSGEN
jgi:hypothetical protein